MIAPCKDCPDRCIGCHSVCAKYKDFRAACDAVSAAKRREFAANEAGRCGATRSGGMPTGLG